jgi:hypothetical protein
VKKAWRPAVEYMIVNHCNLRCNNCDHGSDLAQPWFVDRSEFERDLERLATAARVGEFRILGGEPLLHPHLEDILRIAREARIAEEIVLITNGILLDRLSEVAWEAIDGLWVSIYPGVNLPIGWDALACAAAAHGVWVWKKTTESFLDIYLEEENTNPAFVQHIYRKCPMAHYNSSHVIRSGRYYKCPPSVCIEARLRRRGLGASGFQSDSLDMHDEEFASHLLEFVERRSPLRSCAFCLGNVGRSLPHRQRCDMVAGPDGSNGVSLTERIRTDLLIPASLTLKE